MSFDSTSFSTTSFSSTSFLFSGVEDAAQEPPPPHVLRAGVVRDDMANWDGVTKAVSRVDETGGKVSGLTVGSCVDVLQIFGKTYTVATIKSALKFIGTDNNVTLLWSSGIWRIDSSVTIPANFANHISGGCVFEIATGAVLTFSGPVNVELSTKWFNGTVVCSIGASGFPGW